MLDYYMGFTSKNGGMTQWGKWNDRVMLLAIGETFHVSTECDRKCILRAANKMGMRVKSAKRGDTYEIERINICPPRKRGHPKKHT